MTEADELSRLLTRIRACRACSGVLPLEPRPIIEAGSGARLLVIGQAPGIHAHTSGKTWNDRSGDNLRDWTGLSEDAFYDPDRVAHMPSGFCYPGKGKSGDLPPRPECAPLWHAPLRKPLANVRLTLLVGQYAQKLYLPKNFAPNLTEAVRQWRSAPDGLFPLPHPSWRSRNWMARNPWFEKETLPDLRSRIRQVLSIDGRQVNQGAGSSTGQTDESTCGDAAFRRNFR